MFPKPQTEPDIQASTDSAWSAIIAHMPEDRREAAWRALSRLGSEENGVFCQLLLLLDAHANYVAYLPTSLDEVVEKLETRVKSLEDILKQGGSASAVANSTLLQMTDKLLSEFRLFARKLQLGFIFTFIIFAVGVLCGIGLLKLIHLF